MRVVKVGTLPGKAMEDCPVPGSSATREHDGAARPGLPARAAGLAHCVVPGQDDHVLGGVPWPGTVAPAVGDDPRTHGAPAPLTGYLRGSVGDRSLRVPRAPARPRPRAGARALTRGQGRAAPA